MASMSDPSRSPATLCFDIGGTGLKASVLDQSGHMEHERVRVATPYPLTPQQLVGALVDLARPLPEFDRVSAGFPGMVRAGRILSAPHFVSPKGPGHKPTPDLLKAWDNFDLAGSLQTAFAKPAKVANDADVQGAAAVAGHGLELVVTLGTGVGTALFYEGKLLPHLELAQHPLRGQKTYNGVIGDAARKRLGKKEWNERVAETLEVLRRLVFFDHCYVGGGNAARITFQLPPDVSLVDNDDGILGGFKLWERA